MSISQIDDYQRAYGPQNTAIPGAPVRYFINPLGIQSIILSATELGDTTTLTTDSLEAFSVNANLQPQTSSRSSIKFPLVQGMGFVTGIYTNLQPAVQSSVFFRNVTKNDSPRFGVFKYTATLEDGKEWLIYVIPSNSQDPCFNIISNTLLQGPPGWSGIVQVARNPAGTSGSAYFDGSAGAYASAASIAGNVSIDGTIGTYQLSWTKSGPLTGQPLIMFALPHHQSSFDTPTAGSVTDICLTTTTKGKATAVVADSWTLVESALPKDMGFWPWSPAKGNVTHLSDDAKTAIIRAASGEINQDIGAQSNLNSMYFAGKALSKFATMIYSIHDIANEKSLGQQGLSKLKAAFTLFTTNRQMFPLVYDTVWGGIVSSASYPDKTNDAGADFGNTHYNDHHFHYGYFIHTAAIIGSLDPPWLAENKDWVNSLVRDAANPSLSDNYFPFSRSFDWFHGHSFAKGLFESGDSKDQESTSEDAMFAYAIKMWGRVIGDVSMEARGNLMLSILRRSFQHYFLLQSDNIVQPANFIGNKVTGIVSYLFLLFTSYVNADYHSCSKTKSTTQHISAATLSTFKGKSELLIPIDFLKINASKVFT